MPTQSVVPAYISGYDQPARTEIAYVKERDLTPTEIGALNTFISLENAANRGSDALYFLKALVRIEEATYSTLTKCHIVDIAMRCQQFRRISGRQQVYGSAQRPGYPASDNGIHTRVSLFVVRYRVVGRGWNYVPGIFAVRRAADQDNFIYLKFDGGSTAQQWQFQFEPVIDFVAEVTERPELKLSTGQIRYFYIQNAGDAATVSLPNGSQGFSSGDYGSGCRCYGLSLRNSSRNWRGHSRCVRIIIYNVSTNYYPIVTGKQIGRASCRERV